jgi:DNA adenine methylase
VNRRPQPIIRWAGSKRKLLAKLIPYWSVTNRRYVEPFAGSAALFFELAPRRAVLGDINSDLIATYGTIVAHPRAVYEAITDLKPSRTRYHRLRNIAPGSLSSIDQAARFLYLNRYCFNGLYRTNLHGRFNVPFAPKGAGSFPCWEDFKAAAQQLSLATLVNEDFEKVIKRYVRSRDFVYLDPPYAVANRRVFRQYGPQMFGLSDLERLADALHAINALGAQFLLSYADCPEAAAMFTTWERRKVYTQRNISGFAKHRRIATEILVSNS